MDNTLATLLPPCVSEGWASELIHLMAQLGSSVGMYYLTEEEINIDDLLPKTFSDQEIVELVGFFRGLVRQIENGYRHELIRHFMPQ